MININKYSLYINDLENNKYFLKNPIKVDIYQYFNISKNFMASISDLNINSIGNSENIVIKNIKKMIIELYEFIILNNIYNSNVSNVISNITSNEFLRLKFMLNGYIMERR